MLYTNNNDGIAEDKVRLLEKFREGDTTAFEQIYKQWFGPIYSLLRRLTGSEDDAKDITQDVFSRLWEKRKNIEARRGVESYLFSAARNATVDLFRKKRAAGNYRDGIRISSATPVAPDEVKIAEDLEQLIEKMMIKMSDKRREVFNLSYAGGLTTSEIASQLGYTPKTVDNHLYQARSHIQKLISMLNGEPCKTS
jgi:RNA polymerase sigma-70 factor (ECF subfamily)